MGYPYFNPPYLQKVDKIEEGNYFVPSGGIEPESVKDFETSKEKAIRATKWIALVVAAAAVILMSFLMPNGFMI